MRHLAVYTGSFDPITLGHLDVLARARGMFDELVLAIGHNPSKPALFSFEERLELARACVADLVHAEPAGGPVRVETYSGLTVDFARSVGACAIVRGIRNVSDLASECQLAITNRQV
ncbi:MAG: pantetheine-phosphate adenylyltransferase, partial [Phycisphaerales bacterium]